MILNVSRFLSFWNELAWHTSLFTNSTVRTPSVDQPLTPVLNSKATSQPGDTWKYITSLLHSWVLGFLYNSLCASFSKSQAGYRTQKEFADSFVMCLHQRHKMTWCLESCLLHKYAGRVCDTTSVEFQSRVGEILHGLSLWYFSVHPLTRHKRQQWMSWRSNTWDNYTKIRKSSYSRAALSITGKRYIILGFWASHFCASIKCIRKITCIQLKEKKKSSCETLLHTLKLQTPFLFSFAFHSTFSV